MRDTNASTRSPLGATQLLAFAGPLLWAALVLFHPMPGEDGPYEAIKDDVDRWLFVHVGQLVLTPFLFFAVWRLLDGLSSVAATVSRCALVVWTVFFSAYDSIQGIATGVLIRYANGLAGEEQAAVAGSLDFLVEDSLLAGNFSALALIAGAAWLVVAIAAAVALHKAGSGKAVVAAAALSTVVAAHTAPAAIGLLALAVAVLLRERSKTDTVATARSVAQSRTTT
ncbi:MAG: hypothetical protein ACRDNE_01280 [Gaiellaceae bacterium]